MASATATPVYSIGPAEPFLIESSYCALIVLPGVRVNPETFVVKRLMSPVKPCINLDFSIASACFLNNSLSILNSTAISLASGL